jgi:ubiquitin C-terminal hydrolase
LLSTLSARPKTKIGSGGKVARAYADLLRQLWDGAPASVSPARFKRTIGDFAPQFNGYQQHDAQV